MKYIDIQRIGKMVKQHNKVERERERERMALSSALHTIRTIGCTALVVLAATLVLIGCPDSAGDNNGNGSDTTAPEAVTNVTATPLPSGTGVLLRWTNSVSDDVATITISWRYTVTGILAGSAPAEVGARQITIDNLDYATPYTFVITVADAAGNSSAAMVAANTLPNPIDADGDTLIDINSLERLHNMRYNLDVGAADDDGRYKNSTQTADGQGILCGDNADTPCTGYELTRNLDFTDADSYDGSMPNAMRNWLPNTAADNSGTTITDAADALNPGWWPIAYGAMVSINGTILDTDYAPFSTLFEGNHHTIRNLYIRRRGTVALLGGTGSAAVVRNIGIDSAALYGSDNSDVIGGLIGRNSGGTVSASYANSSINGATSAMADNLGGLIGATIGGTIIASHASGSVTGGTGVTLHHLGGLVGQSDSATLTFIIASYATATVTGGAGNYYIGGLVGQAVNTSTIIASYASGAVTGGASSNHIGGLVGQNTSSPPITIAASYATGAVTGGPGTDLVGALQGVVGDAASRITASYATGNADGGAGTSDSAGRIAAIVPAGSVIASYGFGTATATNINNTGAPPMVGMPPMILTSANGLTLATAGAQWNQASSLTLDAWDFGTTSQSPALKYADYDGDGTDYGCGTTIGTVATIPNRVPDGNGGTIAVDCGTTLLPGQR